MQTTIFATAGMADKKKGNIGWKILISLILAGILVMLGFQVYEWWTARRAHFIKYEAFGIEIPTNYGIHGIDVSKYQDNIDWQSVKEMRVEDVQIGFAFMKATEGNSNEDRQFKRNWKRSKEAGLPRGAYHFFIASKSGKTQAENFISTVQLEPGDLPPVLDVEQSNGVKGEKLRERVKEWLTTVENYYGVKPIIYTNVDFYKQLLKDDFDHYPLWVAHYLQKEKPRIYRDWHFWQHSEQGHVNGILYKVDFNVFNGDSAEFKNLLIH
jgi:lysozyme